MFDKRKDSTEKASPLTAQASPRVEATSPDTFNARNMAVIGSTIRIEGAISGEENLVIEGRVEGSVDLSGHDLTIGQKGQVEANLKAKTVKVEGRITGDIDGSEKVIITKTGRVLGNIVAPRVTLEDGAKFKGSIDMDPGVEVPAATSTPKRSASAAKAEPVEEQRTQSAGN